MSRFNKTRTKVKGGRKREIKSEKEFKAICRNKVSQGLINQADGTWKPIRSAGKAEDMYVKGHHL